MNSVNKSLQLNFYNGDLFNDDVIDNIGDDDVDDSLDLDENYTNKYRSKVF